MANKAVKAKAVKVWVAVGKCYKDIAIPAGCIEASDLSEDGALAKMKRKACAGGCAGGVSCTRVMCRRPVSPVRKGR